MAANWLQNRLIPNNELLDTVLFFRSVSAALLVWKRLLSLATRQIYRWIFELGNNWGVCLHALAIELNPSKVFFTPQEPPVTREEDHLRFQSHAWKRPEAC